ncbi:hypothetical protein [Luteimonas lutimaris]|uniref:Uncharacterized protein n=1 Tax=Luteimonas lutimaris TaxID=698645 RepID=A0ABP7MYP6_9GAMM
MNIKTASIFALLTMLVAGCSQQPTPDAATEADESPAAPVEQVVEKPARGALEEPLPEGVQLNFRYHVRGDRVLDKDGRRDRRRVGMEYLEGDQGTTFASVEKSMTAAGFTLRDRKEMDNGNIRAKFAKPRYGTVIVTVTPGMDVKARNPAAVGRIFLSWPVPKAEESEAG